MEETARKSLTENCKIFHSSELSEQDWGWLKERPEWFDRHLTMIKNKIIIEDAVWTDVEIMREFCRKNFNDLWYMTNEKPNNYSRTEIITVYALDKDELLKLRLTLEKQ